MKNEEEKEEKKEGKVSMQKYENTTRTAIIDMVEVSEIMCHVHLPGRMYSWKYEKRRINGRKRRRSE